MAGLLMSYNIGRAEAHLEMLLEQIEIRHSRNLNRTKAELNGVIDALIEIVHMLLIETKPVVMGAIVTHAFMDVQDKEKEPFQRGRKKSK